MILSSPERLPTRGGLRPEAAVRHWVWDDLGTPASAALSVASPDQPSLHEQELDAAYRRGRAEGEQAAHARARREVETALTAARTVLREVRDARAGWNRVLEENLAALATVVAARLVQRELSTDPATHRELVQHALAAFPGHQEVRVRLHPEDLSTLSAAGHVPGEGEDREVRWVPDEEIVRGGCLVEGPERIVDGRLDEGLKRIFQVLAHG